ncbi:hypothetical protein B7463_g11366, partial [Scytalidium lignicola]
MLIISPRICILVVMFWRQKLLTLALLGTLLAISWKYFTLKPVQYEALFPNSKLSCEQVIAQGYIVYLALSYTLEQHSMTIHRDITPHVERILNFHEDKVVYVGQAIDDDLLTAIQADPNVESVYHSPKIFTDGGNGGRRNTFS